MMYDEKMDSVKAPAGYTSAIDTWNNNFSFDGPGAGIAFRFTITESLSTVLSTSLVYLKMDYQGYYMYLNGTTIHSEKVNYTYNCLGNNTTLALSYLLDSINTSINLGARCQYLKYMEEGNAPGLSYDLNYGITLSAMYFF